MAIIPVKKIQLVATSDQKEKLLPVIQEFGQFQITRTEEDLAAIQSELETLQQIELDYANVEFSIKTLTPYEEKGGFLNDPLTLSRTEVEDKAVKVEYQEINKKVAKYFDTMTGLNNRIAVIQAEISQLQNWEHLSVNLENIGGTEEYNVVFGSIKVAFLDEFKLKFNQLGELLDFQIVSKDKTAANLVLVFQQDLQREVKQLFSEYRLVEIELPEATGNLGEYLKGLKKEMEQKKLTIKKTTRELKKLSHHLNDLKVVYDYLGWQKEKMDTAIQAAQTDSTFSVQGWIPKRKVHNLIYNLEKVSKEFAIEDIEPEEGEAPPVIIKNNNLTTPFETLTQMFGLPKYTEVDPTPFLSVFFILFFALCLTDAGYGIVMFAIMALMLKFVKMGQGAKKLVRLLMYGGLVTAVVGAIFGGWFGLSVESMPDFLTYESASGERMFILQQINSVTNPMAVLILALGLGFAQILFGIYIKLVHDFKQAENKLEPLMDTGTWALMLTGIGFFVLGATGVIPAPADAIGQWWVIGAAVLLILTQGRTQKNIVGKFFTGLLSLYGLVNYMSDVLSYSRLLALGLATSIIGLAVNVIVNLCVGIPYVGWLLAAVIFIAGHAFNLLINALGSFIHSGRLQFVEFFGKFLEGGGKEFRPFSKKTKYVYLKNN